MYSSAAAAMRGLAARVENTITQIGVSTPANYRDLTTVPIGRILQVAPRSDLDGALGVRGTGISDGVSSPSPRILHITESYDDALRYGDSIWGSVVRDLNYMQRPELKNYTMGSEGLNAPLRGETTYPPDMERVRRLDEILAIQPVPEWLQAWKSIKATRLFPDRDIADIRPGDRGHFSDFVSTSLPRSGIERLNSQRERDTDLRIEVAPGTPAIFVGNLSSMGWESELLLGRDLDFEVLEMGPAAEDGRWAGAIRILPPRNPA